MKNKDVKAFFWHTHFFFVITEQRTLISLFSLQNKTSKCLDFTFKGSTGPYYVPGPAASPLPVSRFVLPGCTFDLQIQPENGIRTLTLFGSVCRCNAAADRCIKSRRRHLHGTCLEKNKKKNSRASIQNFKPAWSDLAFVLDLVIYSLTVFFKPGFLKIWTNISKRPQN